MRNNFVCKNSVVGGFDPNDVEILSFKIDRHDHLRKVLNIHVHDHVANDGIDLKVTIDMNTLDEKGVVLINNVDDLVRFDCPLHVENRGGIIRTSFEEN